MTFRQVVLPALLALVISGCGKAGADSWIGRRPPELTGAKLVWINSPPLSLAALKGKVVLLDIWDGTCVNCLRTLPYLTAWHRQYAAAGLVIIGIHAPEFEFEKDPALVREFMKANGITYPVVADNGYEIWNAFHNRYWPRKWLIDRSGVIRGDHTGEGDYEATEKEIRALLAEGGTGLKAAGMTPLVRPEDAPGAVCYPRSDELYLGKERGQRATSGAEWPEGSFETSGTWEQRPQSLHHAVAGPGVFRIRYHGTEVNCVMRSETGAPIEVTVKVDGRWVTAAEKGADVRLGPGGRSTVSVRSAGMFRIIHAPEFGHHVLELGVTAPGFHAYALTFGSCVVPGQAGH